MIQFAICQIDLKFQCNNLIFELSTRTDWNFVLDILYSYVHVHTNVNTVA